MKQLYTKIIASLVFPLHEKLKKHQTLTIRKALEKSQWYSPEVIKEQQQQRLAHFICHIYQNVPYYRSLMDSLALTPKDITMAAQLNKLPLLTKSIIRDNFDALKADNAGPSSLFTTGGSSGSPLTFLLGRERVSHDVAQKWRATRWWGVDIGDKEIVAWGSPIELAAQDKIRLMRDKVLRSTLIPAFDLTDEKILGFIKTMQKIRPKMLFGYPSVFSLIAKTARAENLDLADLGINVVFVTSERLYPYQRAEIEAAFNAPVANGYGGRDAGFIAHQCPAGKMHISAEDIVVELIDQGGNAVPDGQPGEVVVTHMATSDFPFVRYRTGDIAVMDSKACPCGRGLAVLKDIEGRSTDFVVAQNGTMMHGLALIYILRELTGIESFKIIQESQCLTRVLVVTTQGLSEPLKQKIVQGFKARLGQEVAIDIEQVTQIAAEKSGKFRYVVSKVTADINIAVAVAVVQETK